MDDTFEHPRIEPALVDWSRRLAENTTARRRRAEGAGLDPAAMRRSLGDAARQCGEALQRAARGAGWEEPAIALPPPDAPVVLTGHQPEIFHSGIEFKYALTDAFCRSEGLTPWSVVIDTDEGDPASFLYPAWEAGDGAGPEDQGTMAADRIPPLVARRASFCLQPALYAAARLGSADHLRQETSRVADQLCRLQLCEASQRFQEAAADYQRLAGQPAWLANLLVRRRHGIGTGFLELPLSRLAETESWLTMAADILDRCEPFHDAHNRLLRAYRAARKIRGAANPFPDLEASAEGLELPFWLIREAPRRRDAVWVRGQGASRTLVCNGRPAAVWKRGEDLTASLPPGARLVPRGALITAFLRLGCCDLFVHGLGGLRYDAFTDLLIEQWWGAPAPEFVAASASRYLFPAWRSHADRLLAVKHNLREYAFHPQKHFDSGVYPPPLEEELRRLAADKQDCVEQLKQRRAQGEPAADLGRKIQSLSDAMKSSVEQAFAGELAAANRLSDNAVAAVGERTYPWFFFSRAAERATS